MRLDLRVREVAQTPLVPDEVVFAAGDSSRRVPILQRTHVNMADRPGALHLRRARRFRECCDGLDEVCCRGDFGEEAGGDAADAGAAVEGVGEKGESCSVAVATASAGGGGGGGSRKGDGGRGGRMGLWGWVGAAEFGQEVVGAAEVGARDGGVAA